MIKAEISVFKKQKMRKSDKTQSVDKVLSIGKGENMETRADEKGSKEQVCSILKYLFIMKTFKYTQNQREKYNKHSCIQ